MRLVESLGRSLREAAETSAAPRRVRRPRGEDTPEAMNCNLVRVPDKVKHAAMALISGPLSENPQVGEAA